METVLVVAEHSRFDEIKKLFALDGFVFIRAESEKSLKMKIFDLSFSLVIVDSIFPNAKELSIFVSSYDIDTLFVVDEELQASAQSVLLKYGVYVVSQNRNIISAVLGAIRVSKEKIRKAEEKNRKLLDRLRNEKLIVEAKCILAARKGMSEAEAHGYIEKKAMNCRISLMDAAMSIVRELS